MKVERRLGSIRKSNGTHHVIKYVIEIDGNFRTYGTQKIKLTIFLITKLNIQLSCSHY